MPDSPPHPAAISEQQLLKDCTVRRGRRRGPGGQHRNKVETAVVIVHSPSGAKGEASERRSQEQNRRAAVFRLRINLALQVRLAPESVPSELWKSRCVSGRIQVSPTHDDFPALLAESLDVLQASNLDLKAAAEVLGCSPSQLVKFLKLEPRALQLVNDWREERGLRRLS